MVKQKICKNCGDDIFYWNGYGYRHKFRREGSFGSKSCDISCDCIKPEPKKEI